MHCILFTVPALKSGITTVLSTAGFKVTVNIIQNHLLINFCYDNYITNKLLFQQLNLKKHVEIKPTMRYNAFITKENTKGGLLNGQ